MNWSKDRSIALSRGCVVLFMILLAALDIGCYWAVRWFIGLRFMPWQSGVLMMVTIYLCSGFGWVLLVRLWQLLDNIRLQLVFDLRNVKLLRQVSWCCVGAGAVCLVSCLYYLPFIAVAIAAGFMALLVRIVKNIFQQAIDNSRKSGRDDGEAQNFRRRAGRARRHHARESVHSQKQQSQGHPLFHAHGPVP